MAQDNGKILSRRFGRSDAHRIGVYSADGGYRAWRRALLEMKPPEVTAVVKESGLRGRGGAGFPTGVKWGFVPAGADQIYFMVNADESEPGTFKDRFLLDYDPHLVIEGTAISCYAVGATTCFIYIRGEFGWLIDRMNAAVDVHSRILPTFPEGTIVTASRNDVQWIVTEYGATNLYNKSVSYRAKELIRISHPDFREQMTFEAKKCGWL